MSTQDKLVEALRDAETTVLAFLGDVAVDGSICGIKQAIVKGMFARLQSQATESAQAAEPVYQYQATPDSWVDCDYDLYNASGDPKRILYTGPQPAQDAKDGARYRFLADHQDADLYMENPGKELLDRAIDAAMAKESGR